MDNMIMDYYQGIKKENKGDKLKNGWKNKKKIVVDGKICVCI
jgi:hypothetical protein